VGDVEEDAIGTEVIKIVVGSRALRMFSYNWRIWARSTSFYLKAKVGES
jgi:hypothetical protein